MQPILIVNGQVLATYDLLTLLSIIAAGTYFFIKMRSLGVKGSQIGWFIFIGIFVQDIGGTILPYIHHLVHGIPIPPLPRTPGRWFHSIFLSMALYTWFWIRRFKWPAARTMDVFFLAAMIMSAVGRIGCFLNGCCGGKVCDPEHALWALHYVSDPEGVLRHPTQVYSFVIEVAIFFVVSLWDRRRRFDGETFWRGVLIYSAYRFGMGFLRNSPAVFLGLSYAQSFSVLTFLLAGWVLFVRPRRAS